MGDETDREKQARKRTFHRRLSLVVGVPLVVFIVYQCNTRPGDGPITGLYAIDDAHVLVVRGEDDQSTVLLAANGDEEALAATPLDANLRIISSGMHGLFLLLVDSQSLDGLALAIETGQASWSWAAPDEDRLQLPAAATQAEVLGGVFLAFDGHVPKIFALSWSSGEVTWEASLVSGQTIEGIRLANDRLVVWTSGGWAHVIDPQTGAAAVLRDIADSRCLSDGALLFIDSEGELVRAPLSAPNQRDPLGRPFASLLDGGQPLRIVACGTRDDEPVVTLETENGARTELVGLDRRTYERRWHVPLGPGSVAGSPAQRQLVQRWPERDPLAGELPRFTLVRLGGEAAQDSQGELVLVDLDQHAVSRRFGPLDEDRPVGRLGTTSLVLGARSVALVDGDSGEPRLGLGFPGVLPISPEQLTTDGLWLSDGEDLAFCDLVETESACDGGDIEVQTWPDDLDALLRP